MQVIIEPTREQALGFSYKVWGEQTDGPAHRKCHVLMLGPYQDMPPVGKIGEVSSPYAGEYCLQPYLERGNRYNQVHYFRASNTCGWGLSWLTDEQVALIPASLRMIWCPMLMSEVELAPLVFSRKEARVLDRVRVVLTLRTAMPDVLPRDLECVIAEWVCPHLDWATE